jgi:hypothetical protein
MKSTRVLSFLSAAIVLAMSGSVFADFTYNDFSSTAGLSFGGSAFASGNKVVLTPSAQDQRGGVWTQNMQSVGGGFTVTGSFKGAATGGTYDADHHQGVDVASFVLQTAGNNIATIGAYDAATYPRVRVKFDGYRDAGSSDPSSSSVQLVINGVLKKVVEVESLGIRFRDLAAHTCAITYSPQLLNVLVDNVQVMTYQGLDLNSLGLGTSYMGFESYSGVGSWAEHDLLSWSYQSVPEPATLLMLGLGGMLMRRRIAA